MNCNYETKCCKGEDRGMSQSFAPFICSTCHTVENLLIGKSEHKCGPITVKIAPKCNKCNSTNSLIEWDLLTCPKCNNKDMQYHYLPILFD